MTADIPLSAIYFVHINVETNSFNDLGGMQWDIPEKVLAHWNSLPSAEGKTFYKADLIDKNDDIVDEKYVELPVINAVLETLSRPIHHRAILLWGEG
jgi:hypothetical protein